jgi:hypothetical protein
MKRERSFGSNAGVWRRFNKKKWRELQAIFTVKQLEPIQTYILKLRNPEGHAHGNTEAKTEYKILRCLKEGRYTLENFYLAADLEINFIIPYSRGGKEEEDNIQILPRPERLARMPNQLRQKYNDTPEKKENQGSLF